MQRAVQFEMSMQDARRAQEFYENVFNWEFGEVQNIDYTTISSSENGHVEINTAILKPNNSRQKRVNIIDVNDIDSKIELLKQKGGKITVPKMYIPGEGYIAYFEDTEGNINGLRQLEKF